MNKFPLYDSLSKNIPNKDLTASQKRSFVKKIKQIDSNGRELLYVLIKIYEMNCEENQNLNLPYNGIYSGKDIIFDINNLPKKLRHILYKFLGMHLEKMKEDQTIESNTPIKRT